MLPAVYRLKERGDFRRVYQRGKSVATPYFVMVYRPNRQNHCRVGFSVSKKVGKAVVRNRVKRRFRAAAREHMALFPAGLDVVFIVRQGAVNASYQNICGQMVRAVERSLSLSRKGRQGKPVAAERPVAAASAATVAREGEAR